MTYRRQIAFESGVGVLVAGGESQSVGYNLVTWGTYEDTTLCRTEVNGYLDGEQQWYSGSAQLTFQDGSTRRILLRRCGTFACGGLL